MTETTYKGRILVIEDEKSMREVLRILLEEESYHVTTAADGKEGIENLKENIYDLVITDIKMPKADGFEVLKQVTEFSPETLVIIITAFGTTESAVEAMKKGAYDYIHKPFKIDEIRLIVRKAFEKKHLQQELALLREKFQTSSRVENIIGKSPKMQEFFKLIPRVANSTSSVLISGESGTGKELVAAALHNLSPRREKNFVTINCATFPEGLLESEMFGHMKGSFTGAVYSKVGLFEMADGGSIFLDEIGEMPLELQSKLLQVLEQQEFVRVGGLNTIKVDVRIVCATNRDLEVAISNGTIREDLYYRLNEMTVMLPPLRDRVEDIPLLVQHFVDKYTAAYSRTFSGITPAAMQKLVMFPWPGNVRQLENLIKQVVVRNDEGAIDELTSRPVAGRNMVAAPAGTGAYVPTPMPPDTGYSLKKRIDTVVAREERDLIAEVLRKTNWNRRKAADVLEISYRSLLYKIKDYELSKTEL